MTRTVTLVLVDAGGALLGALPAFDVELPYWQEVGEVTVVAAQAYGFEIEVLRLLTTEHARPHGGGVTYLAEVISRDGAPPGRSASLEQVLPEITSLAMTPEVLRAPYATVGGPSASLDWAVSVLGQGYVSAQQRTWNLSAIWRLEAAGATRWLKQVPAFFAHEAAVLAWAGRAAPGAVPHLIEADHQGRMLLEHVVGEDLYDAPAEVREKIVETALRIQWASVAAVDSLVLSGVPDRRGALMSAWVRAALEGSSEAAGHPAMALLDNLDGWMSAVAECGLPDALVHGDEHPGNAVGAAGRMVILDWGDSFVGHPGFDALRLGVGLAEAAADRVVTGWARRWQELVPGSDPLRAVELLRPVEALRLAAVYANFVAHIEPTERRFHSADIVDALNDAVHVTGRTRT